MTTTTNPSAVRAPLLWQLDLAWMLTSHHLQTLTTEECLWRPAPAGLHIHLDDGGAWRADWPEHEGYDLGPSSIGWMSWHMVFWWSMVLDHTFGAATLSREQVRWPGDANALRATLTGLHDRWRAHVAALDDAALAEGSRTRWPFPDRPLAELVAWANAELMKSAAEIGYARFLYAVRGR